MKTILLLYLTFLLSVSCNTKHSSGNSNNTTLASPKSDTSEAGRVKETNSQGMPLAALLDKQPLTFRGRLSGEKSKAQVSAEQMDAGIELIYVTEQWAMEMGFLEHYKADPGFDKWCIFFHEIPGNPPYQFTQKRVIQPVADRYYLMPGSENIQDSKNKNLPAGLIVSARGYLPGEKITIRLMAADAHKEITFYPRPLLLKNGKGEFLGKATLLCPIPKQVLYSLDLPEIHQGEKYKFTSYSGNETLSHNHSGPFHSTYLPEVSGEVSGFGKIRVRFEDGSTYSVQLPWGYKLLEYKAGNR